MFLHELKTHPHGLLESWGYQLFQVHEERDQIHRPRFDDGSAAEVQDLPNEVRPALGLPQDEPHALLIFAAQLERTEHQLTVKDDRRQQALEVMRDPRRELSDGRQPILLLDATLRLERLRHVADDRAVVSLASGLPSTQGKLCEKFLSVFLDPDQLNGLSGKGRTC